MIDNNNDPSESAPEPSYASQLNWYFNYKSYRDTSYYKTHTYYPKPYHRKIIWRAHIEHNVEMGAFVLLTNKYCMVAPNSTRNFASTINQEIGELIPVITAQIANCRIIGRLGVGNSKGLVLPSSVQETELRQLETDVPDGVQIKTVDERLSALGNIVSCNDKIALIHPECEQETAETISDTLGVEVIRQSVKGDGLMGTCCQFNETGGLVHIKASDQEMEELTTLLDIPLVKGTVNGGVTSIGGGLAVNNFWGITGWRTTVKEYVVMEDIFGLKGATIESC